MKLLLLVMSLPSSPCEAIWYFNLLRLETLQGLSGNGTEKPPNLKPNPKHTLLPPDQRRAE